MLSFCRNACDEPKELILCVHLCPLHDRSIREGSLNRKSIQNQPNWFSAVIFCFGFVAGPLMSSLAGVNSLGLLDSVSLSIILCAAVIGCALGWKPLCSVNTLGRQTLVPIGHLLLDSVRVWLNTARFLWAWNSCILEKFFCQACALQNHACKAIDQ